MLRITSGSAKNKKIEIPNVENIRTSLDKVRQAIFSIIGQDLTDYKVLDLFAGSGVLGIEALSRGAKFCDFVDESYEAIQTIEKNLKNCGFVNEMDLDTDFVDFKYETHIQNAGKYVKFYENKYDLIFADPFYKDTAQTFLLQNISRLMKKKTLLVFLHSDLLKIEEILPKTDLKLSDQRKFGQTIVSFLSI